MVNRWKDAVSEISKKTNDIDISKQNNWRPTSSYRESGTDVGKCELSDYIIKYVLHI